MQESITTEFRNPTIKHTHPQLWNQLVMYNIMPSIFVLEDLKIIYDDNDVKDIRITHDVLMMLRRNQIIRVKDRKQRFLNSLPKKETNDSSTVVITSKPSMPPMWEIKPIGDNK